MTLLARTAQCFIGTALFIVSLSASSPEMTTGHEAFARKDYTTAFRIWKPLAEAGDAEAQYNLAILYERGLGVLRDLSQAFDLCHMAALQGLPQAQVELGRLYARGWGTAQRYGDALQWFEKAADQGDPAGQRNVGWLYDQGYGVPQNYKTAAKWYQLAAAQGNAEGQYALANLYLEGNGVHKDPVQAYCLLTRAAVTKKKAAAKVAQLNQKLSTEQIAQALRCAKAAAH